MKRRSPRWYILPLLVLLVLSSFSLTSCLGSQRTPVSAFYDSGANDLTMTGSQVGTIALFRFDTDASQRTLTTASAADIVALFSSPIVGSLTSLAVVADGIHAVVVSGGTNVTVKPSAAIIAGNTTRIIILVLDNVTKGSEAVTIY